MIIVAVKLLPRVLFHSISFTLLNRFQYKLNWQRLIYNVFAMQYIYYILEKYIAHSYVSDSKKIKMNIL